MSPRIAIVALGALAATLPAHADPALDYTVGASFEHSDNINYSHDDPISQNVLIPQLTFNLNQKGSTLDATAAGTLQYYDYLGGAFGDELSTLLAGTANWHISPERFDWIFDDNASRQPINVLAADVPTNMQQTNVFSTGPTLRTKFSDVLRGQLDLRYTNSYADKSDDFNSNRVGGVGSLLYLLDPTDSLNASVTASRVRYTESQSRPFDYDREDAYVGYQRTTREFTLEGAAGYSWLDLRGSGSRSGSLVRGSLRWNPSSRTSFGVNLARQYTDAAEDLVFTPNQVGNVGIGSGIGNTVVAPQVYVEKRVGFDVSHSEDDYRVSLAPYWRKLDYVDDPNSDERANGYYADAAYYIAPTFWLGAFVGHERRRYTTIARTDDDLAYGLSLNLQRTRHWLWSLLARRQRRDSDDVGSRYTENAVILSVTYRR